MAVSEMWQRIYFNEDQICDFHKVLCGNKPGVTLTPELIVKKSSITKQMLAEGFVKLMAIIEEDTALHRKAAENLANEQSKNAKNSDMVIQLQADLIACQEKKLDAFELTFDKKTSEFVDKLSKKMEKLPVPCNSPTNTDDNKKDWSNIDFTKSIQDAVTNSVKIR